MRTNRREFLRLGSIAAIGIAAGLNESVFAAGTDPSLPLLSVGFAPSLPLSDTTPVRLTDASRLLTPDVGFLSHDARLTVRGSRRSDKYVKDKKGPAIDALFPTIGSEAGSYPRYGMWSVREGAVSGQASFTMPVLATSGLAFEIRRDQAVSPLTLVMGGSGGPKLQRGVYVVAIRETSTDKAPDWNRCDLTRSNSKFTVPALSVDYVILEVGYSV